MKSSTHLIILVLALLSFCRLSAGWECKDGYWSVMCFQFIFVHVSVNSRNVIRLYVGSGGRRVYEVNRITQIVGMQGRILFRAFWRPGWMGSR